MRQRYTQQTPGKSVVNLGPMAIANLDRRVADLSDNVRVSRGDQCSVTRSVGQVAAADEVQGAEGLPPAAADVQRSAAVQMRLDVVLP